MIVRGIVKVNEPIDWVKHHQAHTQLLQQTISLGNHLPDERNQLLLTVYLQQNYARQHLLNQFQRIKADYRQLQHVIYDEFEALPKQWFALTLSLALSQKSIEEYGTQGSFFLKRNLKAADLSMGREAPNIHSLLVFGESASWL